MRPPSRCRKVYEDDTWRELNWTACVIAERELAAVLARLAAAPVAALPSPTPTPAAAAPPPSPPPSSAPAPRGNVSLPRVRPVSIAEVLAALRAWRDARAASEGRPAAKVATVAFLEAVARAKPRSRAALREVPGADVVDAYADDLLAVIAGV